MLFLVLVSDEMKDILDAYTPLLPPPFFTDVGIF